MSLDSDHINYLIYRYLQESGFQHSSFTFGQESGVARCSVAGTVIPSGALIGLLQRALNYVQAEVNLTEDGRPADLEDLESIEALSLIECVQPDVCEQRRVQLGRLLKESVRGKEGGDESASMEVDLEIPAERVRQLKGHENEVFTCAWNPKHDILASGAGDSTARLWNLSDGEDADPIVLRHIGADSSEALDITTVDWSRDGALLGTGSADGVARIWTLQGELQNRLTGHSGPVCSLKWNPRGNLLATTSVDNTIVVWLASTGQIQQRFDFGTAPCLDLDWKNNDCFALCSTDTFCYVCEVGQPLPIRTLRGHGDEVNVIKWDPSGAYLASCSDDCAVKIWSMDQEAALHTMEQNDKIYSIKWNPPPPPGSTLPLMLASASFDSTIKVWDAREGACLFTFDAHTSAVYSVDFSLDSHFLVSGSFDSCLYIWSLRTGQMVLSHHGGGGIFEVCWNHDGTKIAACYADTTLSVLSIDQTALEAKALSENS